VTFPALQYPPSRRDDVVDDYHGVRVADPYRWLEDPDSADTIAWTAAQNALTRAALDGTLRERIRAELTRLYDYPRASAPAPRGSRRFFTRNEGLQNQPVLYVQDGLDGGPRVLLDPNTLSADGTVALTAWEPSDDGRLLAYAVSAGGSDWQEIRVRDVARTADLPDRLRWAKFVTISWRADGRAFFYTRFPPEASYHPAVYEHRLGEPQDADPVVFPASADPEIVYEVDQSSDHRVLVVTAFKGASENSVVHVVGGRRIGSFDCAWHFIDGRGGELLLRTNAGAPRGRIVAVDEEGRMREVVPEGPDSLVDARRAGSRIAALYLHDASSRLRLFTLEGREAGEVALPALGSITEMNGEAASDDLFVRFASFTWPPTILRCPVETGGAVPFAAGAAGHVDAGRYETSQVRYASRDGTPVSMFLVRRRGLARDGSRPVWLTGYGGFNINVVPDFDPGHFAWLDRDGVLAVANLRGGGEYGEAWHRAGMLDRKQNVFDDAIAAAEWLIAEGWTRAGRIVLEGGSNGGLLVSAVLTQRPDLPGAVVCRVPVADMLRYHRFTVGRFWIPEYGSADDPAQFPFLYAYSPLHRVRDDVRYPPVLITTAETDDRVDPGMARKLAARLQAAGGGPALIRIESRAGHGAGKPVAKLVEEDADIYTFALRALGGRDEPAN
jgi:prolyl oligopeptidase